MFLWLVYLTETKELELVSTIAPPVFMYIAFAMGADVYSKLRQDPSVASDGRRPECGSKHTGREGKQPDDWSDGNEGADPRPTESEVDRAIDRG